MLALGLIHPFDWGSKYTRDTLRARLKEYWIVTSMSRE